MSAQENDKVAGSRNAESPSGDSRSSDSRRDVAMERLLSHRSGAIGSPATPCPDAEVLAAYVDRGLAENEAARWEVHFATCERCQDILSALAISAPVEESQHQFAVAATAPSTAAQTEQHETPSHSANSPVMIKPARSRKSFWVVGFAAAAVIAYFIFFRGTPVPTDSQQSSPTQIATQNQNQPTSPAPPSGIATNGYVPIPQAADSKLPKTNHKAGETSRPPVNLQDATKEPQIPLNPVVSTDLGGAATASAPARAQPSSGGAAGVVGGVVQSRSAAKGLPSMNAATVSAPAEARVAPAAPPPNPNAQSEKNLDEAVAAAQGEAKTQQPVARKAIGSLLGKRDATSPSDLSAVLIFPGQGTSLWSVGSDGRIDRSNDSGNTWQHQQSGVTSQLLAGSAPNELVCWVVGRNSVILRTTDGGATWAKIPNPQSLNGISVDWVAVFATDALHARISSVDSKRFSTSDGGQTWAPVTQ